MRITKIKQYKKVQSEETVDHVAICYEDGPKKILLHETQRARPEFYKLFSELSAHVAQIGEFNDHEKERFVVTGVSLSYYEDKEGDGSIGVIITAKRRLFSSRNDLVVNTPIRYNEHKDPNQKLSSECWATIEALSAEAEEYIDGKREQVDAINDEEEIAEAEAEAETEE